MHKTISFNGVTKPYLYLLRGSERPAWAPIEHEIIEVPGRPGGYISDTKIKIRRLNLVIGVKVPRGMTIEDIKEDMAAWLIAEKPAALVFSDEPDEIYYARIEGTLNFDVIARLGEGVISFICPDPYKYGKEKQATGINTLAINNQGTARTYPIVEIDVKEPTTFLAIGDGEKMNIVGDPADLAEIPYEPETLIYHHNCSTLVGWGDTTAVEGGEIKGLMATNGYQFLTDNYGQGILWHGPAKKQSIGAELQDFKMDVRLQQMTTQLSHVGSVEVALLDAENKFIAKVIMTKTVNKWDGLATIRAGDELNGHNLIYKYGGAAWYAWAKDFDGLMRVGRRGNTWFCYVGKLYPDGSFGSSGYWEWVDELGIVTNKVAQVQVHLWAYGNYTPTRSRVDDIKVYRLNPPNPGPAYIALPGDKVVFDHENNRILRNGELVKDKKAFIGEYFALNPGQSILTAEPANAIESVEIGWKERWR